MLTLGHEVRPRSAGDVMLPLYTRSVFEGAAEKGKTDTKHQNYKVEDNLYIVLPKMLFAVTELFGNPALQCSDKK